MLALRPLDDLDRRICFSGHTLKTAPFRVFIEALKTPSTAWIHTGGCSRYFQDTQESPKLQETLLMCVGQLAHFCFCDAPVGANADALEAALFPPSAVRTWLR